MVFLAWTLATIFLLLRKTPRDLSHGEFFQLKDAKRFAPAPFR